MTAEIHALVASGTKHEEVAAKFGISRSSVGYHLKKKLVQCPVHGEQWTGGRGDECVRCVALKNHERVLATMAEQHLAKVGSGPERLCGVCNELKPRERFHGSSCSQCKNKAKYKARKASPDQTARFRVYVAKHHQKIRKTPDLLVKLRKRRMSWVHKRLRDGSSFKLRRWIGSAINHALRKHGSGKNGLSWEKLVGYTVGELRSHLEALFKPGMSWFNYGQWHLDHRKPQALFNYDSPDHPEFRACWALSNLQPLWALDNLRKGDTYEEEFLVQA